MQTLEKSCPKCDRLIDEENPMFCQYHCESCEDREISNAECRMEEER